MRRVLTSLVKTTPGGGKDDLDDGAGEQDIKFEYTSDETHSMTVRLEEIDDEDAVIEDRNRNHHVQTMRRK